MYKSTYTNDDGTTYYVFGLDAGEKDQIRAGQPVIFHGGDMGLATLWFVIGYTNSEGTTLLLTKDMPEPTPVERTCVIGLTDPLLYLMEREDVVLDGNKLKLPGHVKLLSAETMREFDEIPGIVDVQAFNADHEAVEVTIANRNY